MQEDRSPRWASWGAVALVVVLVAVNVAWWHAHRAGGPVDLDEAWYLDLAFHASGPGHRVLTAPYVLWREPSFQAPLLPALTLPLHYGLGRTLAVSYLVLSVVLAALVAATYLLGRRLTTTAGWALLAAAVTATLPGIVDYSRHYHFALAATTTFTAGLLTLVRTRRFTHRGWSLGFGLALGLLVLSRTIMLAFAPGLVVAAVWSVTRLPRGERSAAWRNLALALGLAALVAGSWYVFSFRSVWHYLTGWGYGEQSRQYGAASIASARFWLGDAAAVVGEGLYLPTAVLLLAAAVLGTTTGAWRRSCTWRRVADSDALLVAVPLALGAAALLSSRNDGTGFVLPLLPGAVVLVVAVASRARPPMLARVLGGALLAAGAAPLVTKAQVLDPLDREVAVEAAPWARLPVVDASSLIDRYVEAYTGAPNDDRTRAWTDAVDELLAGSSAGEGGTTTDLATTVDGPMVSAPLLQLRAVLAGRDDVRVASVDRSTTDADDPEALAAVLADLTDQGFTRLLTGPERLAWTGFGLPEDLTTAAARRAGFTPAGEVELPDGGRITVWTAPTP